MKGTFVFLHRYAGRGILFFFLSLVLLQLTGTNNVLAQSCGKWSVVSSPGAGDLFGVAALAPDDVWAVGTSGSATLTEHWNGTQWSVVPSPTPVGSYPTLFSVSGVATNDVWAVGNNGMIEHWNGTQWQLVGSSNNGTVFFGVTAISANDAWAVGSTSSNPQTFIEHWNGTQWSVVSHPDYTSTLYAVTALASNQVWTVGDSLYTQRHRVLIEHWDGSAWKMMNNPATPCHPTMSGVTALSTSAVWAVGTIYCFEAPSYPLVERWNGTAWKIVANPGQPGVFSGVAAASPTNVWAVGTRSNYSQAITYHSDGTAWSEVANPILSRSSLNAIAATSNAAFWAVGGYNQNGSGNTLIEYYC